MNPMEVCGPVLIEGLIHEGEILAISGASAEDRSHMAIRLALAVAKEQHNAFFGHPITGAGKVLYVNTTLDPADFMARLRAINHSLPPEGPKELPEETFEVLSHCSFRDLLLRLADTREEEGISLVVIDALEHLQGFQETMEETPGVTLERIYAALKRSAGLVNVAFACVHAPKGRCDERRLSRLAETHLHLEPLPHEEHSLVATFNTRSFPKHPTFLLRRNYICTTLQAELLGIPNALKS